MRIVHGAELAPLTTLGIGGPAASLVELRDLADLPDVVTYARQEMDRHGPPVALGHGSNVLVHDAGCSAPVLRMTNRGIRWSGARDEDRVQVEVQAGHPLADLVAATVAEGLTGMEMLTGIPGTVGAAPVQNVGAYGQEVSDTLVEVRAWDWRLNRHVTLPAAQCELGHRTSVFKRSRRRLLLSLVFSLRRSARSAPVRYRQVTDALGVPPGSRVPLAEAARAVLAVRRAKGMVLGSSLHDERSVGSVFLSPAIPPSRVGELRAAGAPVNRFPDGSTRVSASRLIRDAGFGLGSPVVRGVQISALHPTLVAGDGATAADFARAVDIVRRRVLDRTGVLLSPEIDYLGDWESPSRIRRLPRRGRGPAPAVGES
ncbi:UDP-N-acetylmuramate dehydrogenase [Streptomyces sp. bgisy100]|uniref:UDP-N-acetylmuramate dehydrogenase n=1 Tax=Streptomyces sp. bgisy100 TaxID=3413783 RepID=UPI003D733CBE